MSDTDVETVETNAEGEETPEARTRGEAGVSFDRRTVAKVAFGFVVAGALLYLFGTVIGWGEIIGTLGRADLQWMGLALLSTALCLVVWSKSWDVILGLLGVDIPFRALVPTYYAATFADYITPFGKAGGSPFIAYVLSTDDRASYQVSLVGVLAADLLNLLPFFTFAAVGFVALAVSGQLPRNADILAGGLAVLALLIPGLVYLSWRKQEFVVQIVTSAVEPIAERTSRVSVDSVEARLAEFYGRITVLSGHPRTLAYTLVFGYVGWVFFAAPLYLAGRSLGVPLDPLIVLFIVPASTLAGFVPTPGGLGGVEAALVGLLVTLTPATPEVAAAITLLYRVASYWFVVLAGGVAAFYEIYTH